MPDQYSEQLKGYDVVDVQVTDIQNELFQQVFQAYIHGKLDLPTMPEVAVKIIKVADDPNANLAELAKIVQLDPTVAGSIMQAANSPLYLGSRPIDNIKNAVVRLGLKTTRNLATSIALRDTFKVKSMKVKQRMQELWEHSVNISTLSYIIARNHRGFDPERALMAGLLHDVGAIPILNHIDKQKLELSNDELEDAIIKLRAIVGTLVIDNWGMDAELVTVVEEAELWNRDSTPTADYCDIVVVAQLYEAQQSGKATSLPLLEEIPAYRKLTLGQMDEEKQLQIIEDAQEEIASIKQILKG
jgi:HD-like signal output (HDOD) protein